MTVNSIPINELNAVPFFDKGAWASGRDLSCLSFYVKREWHCWIGVDNRLIKMQMWPSEADYFGDAPERPTDQSFRLFHLTAQRASFPEMRRFSSGIWNDFQNLATSLSKLRLFFETSKTKGRETTRYVQTEIEYIVSVSRSVFDLLQEMIALHWDRVQLHDKSIKKKQLPKSFADVIIASNRPRSAEEIRRKYGLPQVFADWYESHAPFFVTLRKLRDSIAHSGSNSVEMVFATERGYAIQRTQNLWCQFYEWPQEVEMPNQLVPIRPMLCAIIKNVVAATESFAQVFEDTIVLPPALFPGLRFFSRGYYDQEFHEIEEVLKHSWWCDMPTQDSGEVNGMECRENDEQVRLRAYHLALKRGGGQLPAYSPDAAISDFCRAAGQTASASFNGGSDLEARIAEPGP